MNKIDVNQYDNQSEYKNITEENKLEIKSQCQRLKERQKIT